MPKIAIVTGSSSGLGQAIAIRLAQEGYTITCSDLNERSNPPTSFSTVDAIKEKHGTDRAIFHKTDVSDSESVQALIAATVARFGRLDVMVNNAGISLESTHLRGPKLAADTADDTFDKTMAVNLGGVFLGCKYAIRQFLTQELLLGHRGWIVNTASVYGLKPEVGHVSYCTAKAGVVHMTKCLAREYGPSKIHINAICPGFVETSMDRKLYEDSKEDVVKLHPWGSLGLPGDVADAVAWLTSDQVAWVTGVALPVDGGYMTA